MTVLKRAFWGAYALVYDLIWDSPLTRATGERVCRAAARARGAAPREAVDLGCGTGLAARALSEAGSSVAGVDASAAMLARASRRRRLARAVRADAAATGLPAASADAVVASNLLHLHPDPAAVLDEARRVLRPGGVVACAWPAHDLTTAGLLAADLRSGRSLLRSVLALAVREAVDVAGALARARRWTGAEVAALVGDWARARRMAVCATGSVGGVTEYAVLRMGSQGEETT